MIVSLITCTTLIRIKMLAKIILIVLLNIYDLISTLFLINTGCFYEANPIMNTVLENFGQPGFVAAKIFFLSLVFFIYKSSDKLDLQQSRMFSWALNITVAIYVVVFIWQSKLLLEYVYSIN